MSFQTINQPLVSNPLIKAKNSSNGQPIHAYKHIDEILLQDGVSDENIKRLVKLNLSDPDQKVLCYQTVNDKWVVELRANTLRQIFPDIDRLKNLTAVGDQILLRSSDLNVPHSDLLTAGLETRRNILISAQTEKNTYGLDPMSVDPKDILALRALKLPRSIVTKPAEDQGFTGTGNAFRSRATHNMAIAVFSSGIWQKTDLLTFGQIPSNMADNTAVQYGQSGFEGIAATWDGKGNAVILKLEENAKRMQRTCHALGFPPLPAEQFIEAIKEVVRLNAAYLPQEGGRLYIRPFVAGMEGGSGANSATNAIFQVQVWPYGDYLAPRGTKIYLEGDLTLHRPDTGANKIAPNYGISFDAKKEAKSRYPTGETEKKFGDLLMFDREGRVEELSSAAPIFIERTNEGKLKLIVPPNKAEEVSEDGRKFNSLPSITRETVIEIARALGNEVEFRDVYADQLKSENSQFVGMLATGTAVGLLGVQGIDIKTNKNDKNPHPVRFNDLEADQLILSLFDSLSSIRQGTFPAGFESLENRGWVTRIPLA